MEINKTCLDCKFANWYKEIEASGECQWEMPSLLPKWVNKGEYFQHYKWDDRINISKESPHLNCPAWEEDVEKVWKEKVRKLEIVTIKQIASIVKDEVIKMKNPGGILYSHNS